MATLDELVRSDRIIRQSAASLGDALAAVETYAEPALARAVQAEQNLYDRIEAEFGLYTASEAGRRLGSRSNAPRNLAAAARRAGRLLAISRGHQMLYPSFQFDADGLPLPVISSLRALAADCDRTETGIVQWLCSPTTYLDGSRPVDLLVASPQRVLELATQSWNVDW